MRALSWHGRTTSANYLSPVCRAKSLDSMRQRPCRTRKFTRSAEFWPWWHGILRELGWRGVPGRWTKGRLAVRST